MVRSVVLGPGPRVTLHDLPSLITAAASPSASVAYHVTVAAYRREWLLRTLAHSQGNHAAAAKALVLQRTYLQRLLKVLFIQ